MYYTTKTNAVGIAIIPREPVRLEELLYHENQCIWMVGAVGQTCSVRGPRCTISRRGISIIGATGSAL